MSDPNPTDFSNDQGTGTVKADGFIGSISGPIVATTISATGVVSVANGTAAAPEITFTSDTDTGFYRSAANTLGIATGGAAALLIGASGIVTFNVGAVGTPSLTFASDTDTGLYWIGANSFGLAANGVVQATITTAGINGILGATTAAAATVTTLSASGAATFTTATSGPVLKQGANGLVGTFVANGATPVTVSNTSVAITDAIVISLNTVGGTVGVQPHVATITGASGFTVVCTASDTSTYNYALIKNAA